MGAPEQAVIDRVLRGMDTGRDRLFRINAGTGWVGRVVQHTGRILTLADPRPLRAAPPGWPDLFGWRSHIVTEADVGRVLAVARGVEVKAAGGTLCDAQARFCAMLESMGGIFEIET
jgi:hypothetical protein